MGSLGVSHLHMVASFSYVMSSVLQLSSVTTVVPPVSLVQGCDRAWLGDIRSSYPTWVPLQPSFHQAAIELETNVAPEEPVQYITFVYLTELMLVNWDDLKKISKIRKTYARYVISTDFEGKSRMSNETGVPCKTYQSCGSQRTMR